MSMPEKLFKAVTTSALMTPRQREIVQRDIKVLEKALHGEAMPYFGGDPMAQSYDPGAGPLVGPPTGHVRVLREMPVPSRENLERNLRACQNTLAAGAPPALSTAAKNAIYQQYKADWQAYQEGMPSHEQMWRPQWQNVQLYMQHKAANVARARRLQNAHRILEPDDDVFHLEALRPEKPTPYNGSAFRAGYDHIQWTEAKELEMQVAELDDETYYSFLQMKAAGITARKLYEDKLSISRQQYEACEARLKASAIGTEDATGEDDEAMPDPDDDYDHPGTSDHARELMQKASIAGKKPQMPQTPRKAKGRTSATPARSAMTAQAEQAVHEYGDMLLLVAEEAPLDAASAAEVLKQLDPEKFRKPLLASNTARQVLTVLVKAGRLRKDGAQYVVVPIAQEAMSAS